jgi:hypothetical protein
VIAKFNPYVTVSSTISEVRHFHVLRLGRCIENSPERESKEDRQTHMQSDFAHSPPHLKDYF